jgi:hypothetical protein
MRDALRVLALIAVIVMASCPTLALAQPAEPGPPPGQQPQGFGPANSLMPANVFLAAPRDHTAEAERELERYSRSGREIGVIFLGMMPFCSWRRCASAGYWCSCAHYISLALKRDSRFRTPRWSRTESSPAS